MKNTKYFHIGELVSASSLTGQKIIGNYAGNHPTNGCYVKGRLADQPDSETNIYRCSRLSLVRLEKPKKHVPKNVHRNILPPGTPCIGRTKDGEIIQGQFQQVQGEHAWIRQDGQAKKVLRDSLLTL